MMEWDDYQWAWSENNAILALQYLVNGLWALIGFIICVFSFIGSMAILTNGFKV